MARIRSAVSVTSLRGHTIWFLLYFCLILAVQWRTGAYFDDFSATSDEPSHFSNSLVVHDYLAGGFPEPPVAFLYRMYARYPKIAIGHWPPGFYLVMAVWMLFFGVTRTSALILIAICSAVLAVIIRGSILKETGPLEAGLSPLFGLLLPASSLYTASIMMEVPLALFATLSAIALVRLLETEKWTWAILTGLFLSMAACTKGNALALVPAYVAAIIVAAGWKWLFRIRFITPLVLMAVLSAPVFVLSLKATTHWAGVSAGLSFTTQALEIYPAALWAQFGPVLLAVILYGMVWVWVRPQERRKPIWAVASAWLLFTLIFHVLVPMAIEFRYLSCGFPAVCWFGAVGIARIRRPLHWAAAAAVLCVFLVNAAQTPRRARGAMSAAVERVFELGLPQLNKGVFVASTDASGEGRAIAEGFERDRQHQFVFFRATKYISDSDWMGHRYSLILQTPEAVEKKIDAIPAAFVIVQRDSSLTSREAVMAERTMRQYADDWKLVFHQQTPLPGKAYETIDVYRSQRNSQLPIGPVMVNLRDATGEALYIKVQ